MEFWLFDDVQPKSWECLMLGDPDCKRLLALEDKLELKGPSEHRKLRGSVFDFRGPMNQLKRSALRAMLKLRIL